MAQRQYKKGINRGQAEIFPPSLDEYISEKNPVRAIDAYVETLDLTELGFGKTTANVNASGQPAYAPHGLLKLYLYGYLNRIRSSRLLERECGRNIEMMWLLEKLAPCYKTIADFRKDNPKALRRTHQHRRVIAQRITPNVSKTFTSLKFNRVTDPASSINLAFNQMMKSKIRPVFDLPYMTTLNGIIMK